MGAGTLGDTFTAYIKPSLNGEIVLRKPTSTQTSSRLKARQKKLEVLKNSPNAPATLAHKQCSTDKKTVMKKVYVSGEGYKDVEVCPIKDMKSYLKAQLNKI